MVQQHYPMLEVNLDAIRNNAQVLCGLCGKYGIARYNEAADLGGLDGLF